MRRVLVTGGVARHRPGRLRGLRREGRPGGGAQHPRTALDLPGSVAVAGDVSDPEQVRAFVDAAAEQLGGLDVVVSNAGVYDELDPLTATYEQWQAHWRRTVDVDLLGPAWLAHCALPHLIASPAGRLVHVGSRGASRGEPTAVAYAAAKAGLTAMGQSLAQALAPHGVSVTSVLPGFVETEMARHVLDGPRGDAVRAQSPAGRVATPQEVAAAVLFCASEDAFWSTGAVLDVNGASYLRT